VVAEVVLDGKTTLPLYQDKHILLWLGQPVVEEIVISLIPAQSRVEGVTAVAVVELVELTLVMVEAMVDMVPLPLILIVNI
jgi:hypothetical protein